MTTHSEQNEHNTQDTRYLEAVESFGASLQRLVRAAEADRVRQQDLLQDIHLALWRSFATFDGRCALGTWVFRVAHNTTVSYVIRERRQVSRPMQLDEIEGIPDSISLMQLIETEDALEKLYTWIRQLKTVDRQVLTLYLEELNAQDIADITGITSGAVATRISRLKLQLAKDLNEANHD